MNFTKHQEDNAFVVESTLRDIKQMDPFVVKWEYPLLVPDTCLNPGKLKTAVMKKVGGAGGYHDDSIEGQGDQGYGHVWIHVLPWKRWQLTRL